MQRGGARPGAGRPRKAVLYVSPIRDAEGKICQRLPWLLDKLFELAEGVTMSDTDRSGKPRIYKTAPDRQSIEYLIDRVMGKPTQPIDVVQTVRTLAAEQGLTAEEQDAAVAEAERYLEGMRAGHR